MPGPADDQIVRRFDRIPFGTITRADDGSITSEAVITKAGVFSYRLPDGSIQKEFRSPEEVFKADSMASAKMLPITNNHPPTVFVDPATAKDLTIGFTGENVSRADYTLVAPVKINTQEGIKAVEDGRRQFSCGYEAKVVKQDGIWQGEAFTHAQVGIKYNHLALVDSGRAGPIASLRLDAADAIMLEIEAPKGPDARKEPTKMESQIKLDNGLSYKCDAEVAVEMEKTRAARDAAVTKLDAATASITAITAERDTLQGKADELQKKIDEFDASLAEKVLAGVAERSAILDGARKIITGEDAKKLDAMSVEEIRKAVVAKARPEIKLDEKPPGYLVGVYEAIVAGGAPSKQGANGAKIVGDGSRKTDAGEADPEQARLDGMNKMAEASRAPIGGAAK